MLLRMRAWARCRLALVDHVRSCGCAGRAQEHTLWGASPSRAGLVQNWNSFRSSGLPSKATDLMGCLQRGQARTA